MKPRLIGQWFMTIKYLLSFPTYSKHSTIKVSVYVYMHMYKYHIYIYAYV